MKREKKEKGEKGSGRKERNCKHEKAIRFPVKVFALKY